MNFVKARVNAVSDGNATVELPGGVLVNMPATNRPLHQGDAVTFGIRPEHLVQSGIGATLSGEAEVVEELGDSHLVYCR
ncbi:hypothetical protein J8J40_31170, partial [Mycobacterium tuberculosis]|nr:hypothetical protein [Mycobacterium tuberculosis]